MTWTTQTDLRFTVVSIEESDSPRTVAAVHIELELVKRTTASEQCCLQQLFNQEELGDRKPSQLLQQMQ